MKLIQGVFDTTTKVMDHHGLVDAVCQDLGIAEKINAQIGSKDPRRKVQPGLAVVVVANRIVDEFPRLLDSFQPYKNYLIDGRDWTSPTFYRWCNEACSTFNNKSELAIE